MISQQHWIFGDLPISMRVSHGLIHDSAVIDESVFDPGDISLL